MATPLTRSLFQTIAALSRAIEIRDLYTHGHHQRTSALARKIGQTLGLDSQALEGLRVAGNLHDTGKIGVPFEVLAKPAKLTAKEFDLVREHVEIGAEVLALVEFPWPVLAMVRQHHERLDGSGYPQGLRGDAILFESRIIAVADSVDSMVSHRPYRPGQTIPWVVSELEKGRGRLFDPDVLDACLKVITDPEYQHHNIAGTRPRSDSANNGST